MSQRPRLARFLFDVVSSSANRTTWRTVVASAAMLGATTIASADDKAKPAPNPAPVEAKSQPAAIMQPPAPTGPVLQLARTDFDFGTQIAGKKKTYDVVITNAGTTPLKLDKKLVTSSCACLKVAFSKTTVAPGKTAKLRLTFAAPREAGDAAHTVLVKYVTDPATKAEGSATLNFAGVVEAPRPRTPPVQRFEGRGFILS